MSWLEEVLPNWPQWQEALLIPGRCVVGAEVGH